MPSATTAQTVALVVVVVVVGIRLVRDAQAVRVPVPRWIGAVAPMVVSSTDTCQDDSWAVSVLLTGSRPETGGDIPAPDRLPLNG